MKRVLMTGATGYLGSLIRLYNAGTFEIACVSRADVDYTKPEEVAAYVAAQEFDVCVHMAADASTAHCESDPAGTHLVNTDSAIAIARTCHELGRRVVFISTEQCFNAAEGPTPFAEDDEMASVSRYGQQKMEADAWIRGNVDDYLILRLSWMFGLPMPGVRTSPNILSNVIRAMKGGESTAFRVHERRCMTYAQRLAGQFAKVLSLPSGAYHFASDNNLTTYEAARHTALALGYSENEVARVILPDEETYAERPRDFRLDSSKIRAAGIELGTFETDLAACLRDFGR